MDKRQELINALQDADESIPVDVDENENWEFTPTVTFPLLTRKRYKLHSSDIHSGSKLRRLNLDDALIMVSLYLPYYCSLPVFTRPKKKRRKVPNQLLHVNHVNQRKTMTMQAIMKIYLQPATLVPRLRVSLPFETHG